MAIAALHTRVIYGLKTDIIGNAHYISDTDILYPVGNVLALHNIPQRRQKLIRLPDKYQVTIICVAPNKKYAAVCESGDKPTISIYDLESLKRKKSLGIPYDAPGVTKFSCVCFTHDSKYLAAVTDEPDQNMLFYNWEKGKIESSIKVGSADCIVNVIACNPGDTGVMALGGTHTFKFLTVAETIWRPYGFSKAENLLISSMAWLNTDRLLVGTKDGRILYLENGDLKNIYTMNDATLMNLKIKEEYVIQTSTSKTSLDGTTDTVWEENIRTLIAFPKGFAFSFGAGTIVLFEKQGPHKYSKRNIFVVPQQVATNEVPSLYEINTININISHDRLIVTTGWSQLFYAVLWGSDITVDPKPQELKIMGQALHYGSISNLSMCAWKPIFMTCGEVDRSIRLWDFETESLIMVKQYSEDISSISLHPTGLFCLIGFSDKLRFMSILIDDVLPLQEFPIRNCKTVLFSNNGHLFAAVNGNVIHVYTTIGLSNSFLFKGHTGKIKGLVWSQTDMKLYSMGSEGAIYEWDLCTGSRSGEIILKGISLYDIVLSSDNTYYYCIASDNCIREIKEHAVTRMFNTPGIQMYCMIMGQDDTLLFATSPGGIILSFRCPLQEPIEHINFHMHCTDITNIALSYNEQYLVSTGTDGSLCMWKLYYSDGKVVKMDKEIKYTHEVLIGKGDLEEKIKTIGDLTMRLQELETENTYKLRQIEIQHNDKLREIHQAYSEVIEELRIKIDKLQDDHTNELNNVNVEIVKMKAAHEEAMHQMENSYDAKLIVEYDKYRAFEDHTNTMRQDYEIRLAELDKERAKELNETIKMYEAELHKKTDLIEETEEEMKHQVRVHEQVLSQIEDDADKEILELRAEYETLLHDEKQANLRLKGEAGVMRNKYMASQKDVDDLKRQVQRVQGEYAQFQTTIRDLEKCITDLRKEIGDRDTTIQDKEQQIYELKRTIQELEKFKFVLNYKISELKNQIEPRDQEIKDLKEKITDMETELVNLHKTNVSLDLQLHELREKLGASQQEVQKEIQRNKRCERVLRKIRVDLLDASSLIQEPHALKAAVTKLYHKYSASDEFLRSRKADLDAQCEFLRQREHLERTVMSLRKHVFKDTSGRSKGGEKLMEQNVILIEELNVLREELQTAKTHIKCVENILGLQSKDLEPTEARKKLDVVCRGYEEIKNQLSLQMQECERVITALKEDIERLLSKISCEASEESKSSF